jgi:Kdo2-lipid IVA lauroyltransferase/acyltransferase
MKSPMRHRLEQSLSAGGASLANSLAVLPLRSVRRLADAWAQVVMAASPRRQRLADENLAAAFPELPPAERRGIRRRSVVSVCRTMLELLKLPRLSATDLEDLIETDDLEPVREALREGNGVMLITGHFGNWELLAAHLSHQVRPLTVIARDASHPVTASLINRARESHGIKVIGRRDTREMLRVLNSGGVLGMLPDQHAAEGGMLMEFLGRPAWTFTGPALLASRTRARVFAVFCVRQFEGPFRLVLLPEIRLASTGDRDADVVTNTRLINGVIEQAIREHPDNWLWLHNRWKRPVREARGA